ncbi:alpha-amylase family glycosyl hydrolase [Marinilabilia rubra]|uniref:Alpha-amylase n=1 Tax=Marinilabilia rubra TaxID=2162893 RepID=A0A2U2BBZ9_9BACT|nr:alpha-amylase family glycosyl hydrolase [Marinilabilia rubra]PWE00588.1 alpha-amylase [Marinilabilia rubra]
MTTYKFFFLLLLIPVFFSCGNPKSEKRPAEKTRTAYENPPEWAKEAIWYQIYADRFRNGDPNNDPTPEDLKGAYPGFVPESWTITPWTQDWYKHDPHFKDLIGKVDMAGDTMKVFPMFSRLRRYGGDLQGVMDKIDYLDSLGITAIYFNPLCEGPSEHNFDASAWRHIDNNFGPTPREDLEIMDSEEPDDPTTWKMTGADKMFVELVAKLHERGIRVILDYSWNHTGIEFWAWKDILKKQARSEYKDWYWIKKFDDPRTPENEFEYEGWFGVKDLPEIKETVYHPIENGVIKFFEGNIFSEDAKNHIFNVTRKWLDPNGDGDPSDGIDGYRLDVASEVPLGFWRDFREVVREVNPDAYLVGEVWFELWPDRMQDPQPVLEGDIFDGVMNYRLYKSARHFFAKAPYEIPPSEFVDSINSFYSNLRPQNSRAMMNVVSSHDSPRLATSLFNDNSKYNYYADPVGNPDYKINKPDAETYEKVKLLLAFQYTFLGAPHIWAGDEMGMWGAMMGDTRKPLIWKDYDFEPETIDPRGYDRKPDEVKFNDELFAHYQKLIRIRKENPVLSHGEIDYEVVDDENKILVYSRYDGKNEVIAAFNVSNEAKTIEIPLKYNGEYTELLKRYNFSQNNKMITMKLPAGQAVIISKQ